MNEARKKALGILNYRAMNMEMMAQFAASRENLLGEDAEAVAAAFAEAARVIREQVKLIEKREETMSFRTSRCCREP